MSEQNLPRKAQGHTGQHPRKRVDTRVWEKDKKYGGRLLHRVGTDNYKSKTPDPAKPGADISHSFKASGWMEARKVHEKRLVATDEGEEVRPSRATHVDMMRSVKTKFEGKIATGERAPGTLERYELQFKKHIKDELRGPVQKHGGTQIEAWLTRKRKAGLSASTITSLYRLLSLLYNEAVKQRVIRESPLKQIDDPPRQRSKAPARRLTDEECSQLIAATPVAYRVLVALLCFTGLRISEGLGLLWENVDLGEGILHVEAQLARKKRGEPVKRIPLKGARREGGDRREVDLVPEAVSMLKRHKADAFATMQAGAGDFVFSTSVGTPLTYKNFLDRVFTPAAGAAGLNRDGLPRLTPHDLRHTAVSRWIAAELDPVEVARQAGDTVEVIMSTYAGEFDRMRRSKTIRQKIAAGTKIEVA